MTPRYLVLFIVYLLVLVTGCYAIMPKKKSQSIDNNFSPMRQIREEIGMTQAELAVALGMSYSTVSKAERGLTEPVFTIAQIKKLCKLTKKPIEDFPDFLGKDFLPLNK